MWLAPRPAPAPAGDPQVVSRFLPTREYSKQHHNPASHHECKNTRHRDAAATCTYRRTLWPIKSQSYMKRHKKKTLLILLIIMIQGGCCSNIPCRDSKCTLTFGGMCMLPQHRGGACFCTRGAMQGYDVICLFSRWQKP